MKPWRYMSKREMVDVLTEVLRRLPECNPQDPKMDSVEGECGKCGNCELLADVRHIIKQIEE